MPSSHPTANLVGPAPREYSSAACSAKCTSASAVLLCMRRTPDALQARAAPGSNNTIASHGAGHRMNW